MKVLNARVRWMQGYANSPTLEILVDRFPTESDYRYEHKPPAAYYAEAEGSVRFFAYTGPGEGYGGREFEIRMKGTGRRVTLVGPWSSRAGYMNSIGFGPCVDVSITEDPKAFARGHTFYSGAVTLELAQAAAKIAGCFLVKVGGAEESVDGKDVRWDPSIREDRVEKMPAEEPDRTETTYPESTR